MSVQVCQIQAGGHGVADTGVGVERECTRPGPNTYPQAHFRFAQNAFIRLDTAFLAAALHSRALSS